MTSSESIDLLWNESIQKLKALVQDEETAASKSTASIQDAYRHFGNLYVRYTIVLKDLDTCYVLSVQPQKRLDIKSALEHVICRVINLRHLLRKWSPPNNDVIVKDGVQPPFPWEYLDINKVLDDLSIAPSRLETTTPAYFKEERQDAIRHRNEFVARLLKEKFGLESRLLEEKTWSVESSLAADVQSGTSCAYDYDTTCTTDPPLVEDSGSDMDSNSSDSETATVEENQSEHQAAKVVQSLVRGCLSRKKTAKYKQWLDSLVGISSSRKSHGTEWDELVNNLTDIHNRRQQEQQYCKESYENDLHRLRDVVREEEGFIMQNELREERIKWMIEHTIKKASLPDSFEGFYAKEDTPPNDNDNVVKEKNKKDAKSKETTDKKSKDKKSANAETVELPTLAAPQTLLDSLKDCVQTYEERWMNRTVGPNRVKSQYHDTEMAKDLIIRDQVKDELTSGVEEMMLDNIQKIKATQELPNTKKSKKGGKEKGKKAKGIKGKKKDKPLPGTKLLGMKDMSVDEMLSILVKNGLVCCTPEEHTLDDFIGGFKCARPKLPNLDKKQERWIPNDPSAFQLRKTVMDYLILPLGSESIKSIQDDENIRSILFYGPEGSGKTLMVQTIASETGALVINLSSSSIGSSFGGKEGATKLIHMAFTVAKEKEYAPVIIYLDDCHEFFMGKKSKRGGGGLANVNADMQRFQRDLLIYKNQALTKDDRVIVIGCTNMPEIGDTKLLRWKGSSGKPEKQGFFERALYFPRADHADRAILWKAFIQRRISEFNKQLSFPELDYDALAFMSDGFNAGQILSTVHSVLSEERVKNLALSSESLSEKDFASFFSVPKELAMQDDERFLNFTRQITTLDTVWKGINVVDKKADGKKKK